MRHPRDLFLAQMGIAALVACALILLVMRPAFADPYTCNASGCTWNTKFTEPSTLTNGQPLTDLTGCTVSYTTAVDGGTPGSAKTYTIPASKISGGGAVNVNNTDPTMVPSHVYLITATVACNSTAFGTGPSSAPATLPMNNGVTVNTGTGLTIQ